MQHVGVATPRDRGGSYLQAEAEAFVKSWIESTILFDLYSKQLCKTVVNCAQVRVHIRLALKLIGQLTIYCLRLQQLANQCFVGQFISSMFAGIFVYLFSSYRTTISSAHKQCVFAMNPIRATKKGSSRQKCNIATYTGKVIAIAIIYNKHLFYFSLSQC